MSSFTDYSKGDNVEDYPDYDHNRHAYDKQHVVSTVRNFLSEIENTRGQRNKREIVVKMMNFLVANKGFLDDYKRFSDTVRKKIHEFTITENWRLEYQYKRLFNEELPCTRILKCMYPEFKEKVHF